MVKKMFLLLVVIIFFASISQASLLTSSEIIGSRKLVLQMGYGSSNYGSLTSYNQRGIDVKLGYGLAYPLDVLISGVAGNYPSASTKTSQGLGIDLRYGILKGIYGEKTPMDVSVLMGVLGNNTFNSGSMSAQETEYHVMAVIGKSYRKPTAYATPYLGTKLSSTYNASGNWLRTSQEIALGFNYGLSSFLSLMVEGNYSWFDSTNRGAGVGAGVACKI